ncbi:MAG: sigma-54-dependent Fis family transcriptional regulator [Pirellulales bacterium]|nr:sigma-54-dependent Fis family transcriptional regulator [Pirellulales bacterium]
MAHLLIVDDEQSICWGLRKLAEELGHRATIAASAEAGLEQARRDPPEVVFLDVRLPGRSGLDAMADFHRQLGPVPIIVMTAYGELATAVAAVRNGAFDYLTKPFDLGVAQRAIERALLAPETSATPPRPRSAEGTEPMVGASPPMQEVFKRIALVAASDACVHLQGESGSGKELAARAIHRYSRRAEGPFVPVNVASLSPSLAESELFGHVRGAFTGADQARRGLLEQAHGGTIFLDEVADIPLSIQVKLLRALEHGEVLPVGGDRPVRADFRIISATHQNLAQRVAEGAFRHDLYYRLVTFEIVIPPLRERREDIRPLVEHFLIQLAARAGKGRLAIAEEALAEIQRYPWYGNVRELRNALEHALVLARGGLITLEHLPPPAPPLAAAAAIRQDALAGLIRQWTQTQLDNPDAPRELYEAFLSLVEPPLFETAMRHFRGQCAPAARRLGLHRTTLRKKLDRFGIKGE